MPMPLLSPFKSSSFHFGSFTFRTPRLTFWRASTLAWLLVAALPAHAVSDAQFEPAFATFVQASSGQSSAIEAAAQAFGTLLKTEPTHPVLLAYSGAATSLRATATWLPWKKLAYAEDGLAQIDKALALLTPAHNSPMLRGTPGVLEVKLVAANTFLAVPGFMNRHDRGERLLKEVLTSPLLATAQPEFRATVDKAAAKAGMAVASDAGGAAGVAGAAK